MKIYQIFMVPKPGELRLSTRMQFMNTNWQTLEQSHGLAAMEHITVESHKESKLKLSLEARNRGDVIVVHCQGRIVYRDEVAALSRMVGDILQNASKVVLELSGVSVIDSAGIGGLALLQSWAQEKNATLKCAGANSLVRTMLGLTNLDTVIEVHASLESAIDSFREEQVCADC
jgi:anti-anti-sigma factor